MKRRTFSKHIATAATLPLVAPFLKPSSTPNPVKRLKPKRLKKGDTIGLLTPGSFISDEALEKSVKNLEDLGFVVKLSKNIRAQRGFTAGTDEERLNDLHTLFADTQVDGIWCARGGYGCSRLLPYVDYKLIQKNPKVFIGYSDVTALLLALYKKTGLIGFHGPVGASDFSDYTKEHVQKVLMDAVEPLVIPLSSENIEKGKEDAVYQTQVLRPGKATGELIGGNLSLLSALSGTAYDFDAKNKLVFIEDIDERPYRIDRMLTQLRQANNLGEAAGIALGVFTDCQPEEGDLSLSLMDTLKDRLEGLNIPVIYGLSFGHIANQCTLPVGISATLDTERMTLTLLEAGVS